MPTLETERLILRDFVLSDWDALNAFLSDPAVTRYMHFASWNEDRRREWLTRLVQEASDPHRDAYNLAITRRDNGLLIGWLIVGRSRHARDPGMRECGCGYALDQHHWGQGYMPEALQAAFTYAFTVLGTRLIHAECEQANSASARVMRKCGMQYEGTTYDDDGLGNWAHRDRYVISSQATPEPPGCRQAGIRHTSRAPIRILLSEGSSLSARQTITALSRYGYTLDVCDPNPLCISRFSRFVRRYYRCPPLGTDPIGYLTFIRHLLAQEHYDVLLPVHEQAFLFAKVQNQLPTGVSVALADFNAFLQVQGKVAFARLMERLSLPQPMTHILRSRAELEAIDHFPCYFKTDYSTAGQGVWRVTDRVERDRTARALEHLGLLGGSSEIIVQEEASGALCQAQAVFAHGQLIAVHCTQTRGVSVGGGHAARTGMDHPQVLPHLVALGLALEWHGPLALDYLFDEATGRPTYIEANPRLVEPMNATLSGVNLADITVRVALGEVEASDDTRCGRSGIRSHSLLAILLGVADHGGSRRQVLNTLVEDIRGCGIFARSREDLTPIRVDPPSLIPLCVVTGQLLLRPRAAHHISTGAVSTYSLTAAAVETIRALDGQ